MTFLLVNRVRETCISPGTGTAVLAGAALGYQTFSAGVGANNTTYYVIADQSGANWEVGYGTVGALGTTLARTTVLSSSNGGSLVNFTSGTQDVWVDYPANKAVFQDSTGTVSVPVLLTTSTTSTTPNLSFNASNTGFAVGASVSGSYLQSMLQNKSGTAGASTNYVLSNDLGTDSTYYGEFGMNSSVFSASTPSDFFSINNGIYFSGHDGDVIVGSGNGYKHYFAWGTTGQSAHVINASGALGFSTNLGTTPALSGTTGYGTAGQVPVSAGSTGAVSWSSTPTLTGTNFTGVPISTAISGLGTGVASALAIAIGSAGAPVTFNGALGTPSSGTLTNATGLPVSTGISGLGTGVATALAVSVGSAGSFVTNGGALGTPSSGVATNLTGTASGLSIGGNAATATTAATANALNTANTYQSVAYYATGLGAIGQINMSYGSASTWYNAGWRNDGSSFYLLLSSVQTTQSAAISASFNALRPFTVNLSTGGLSFDGTGVGSSFGGALSATSFIGAGTGLTGTAASLSIGGNAANVTGTVAIGNGGTGATTAATARTNLGATTVGSNFFTLANPTAITFPRINADNTVSALDAATFRTAIGAGTSSTTGTVTSVATGTGLTGGTITTSGTISVSTTYSQYAKAFARWNGIGGVTIAASYNISSITRFATAAYTVTFTTPFPDANYSGAGIGVDSQGPVTTWASPTASNCVVSTIIPNVSLSEGPYTSIVFFR